MTETQPTYARAGRPLIHYIENERAHQLHTFTTRMHTVENRPANLHTYGHMQSPKFPQICCRAKNMSRVHLQVKLDAAKNSIVFLLTFQNSVNYFQYENHHFSIPKDTPLNQSPFWSSSWILCNTWNGSEMKLKWSHLKRIWNESWANAPLCIAPLWTQNPTVLEFKELSAKNMRFDDKNGQ